MRARRTIVAIAALGAAVLAGSAVLAFAVAQRDDPERARVLLADARDVTQRHAASMRDQAARLAETAETTGQHREHWIADAASMRADADRLAALAALLEKQVAGVAHVVEGPSGDLRALREMGRTLAIEGRAIADHGRAMLPHAQQMVELARAADGGRMVTEAGALGLAAGWMADAGDRASQAGEALSRSAEGMLRGLAR